LDPCLQSRSAAGDQMCGLSESGRAAQLENQRKTVHSHEWHSTPQGPSGNAYGQPADAVPHTIAQKPFYETPRTIANGSLGVWCRLSAPRNNQEKTMNVFSILMLAPILAFASTPLPEASPDVSAPAAVVDMQQPQGQGEQKPEFLCPMRKSVILPGSPASASTTPTTTCDNGRSCGFVRTYNPPATECRTSTLETCCVEQMQRAYSQTFSCQPDPTNPQVTICTGGDKSPFGSSHVVSVTVACETSPAGCATPGAY
jgi:hypothetical protein